MGRTKVHTCRRGYSSTEVPGIKTLIPSRLDLNFDHGHLLVQNQQWTLHKNEVFHEGFLQ